MDIYKLAAVLSLEDRLSGPMGKAQGAMLAAGAAVAGAGLKIGADWDRATDTIIDGTGATGVALKGLQTDFQAVAKHGAEEAAAAIADLNTHLGLTGPELQDVSGYALMAGINTSKFGSVAEQTERDVEGYKLMLDQLTVAGQKTGVSANQLLDTVGKNSARWQAAGGDVEGLMAHVVELADEFGPSGLRGAMSETMAEVDKGNIPTIRALEATLGDTTGAVERTYEAGQQWHDVLGEMKNAAMAYLGPAGNMLAGVGGLTVGLSQVIPMLAGTKLGIAAVAIAQRAWNVVMNLNPIMLIVTALILAGAAVWKFRDQIMDFLKGAWNAFVGAIEGAIDFLRPLASFIGIELPDDLGSWKIAQEEATEAVEAAEPAVSGLDTATVAMATTMATKAVPAVTAAKVEIEAFDLASVKLTGQLQQYTKPAIKDVGDLLEASGLQAGAAVVPWGFFADETSVKVPNAMDIVMDSIMKVPPTAERVAQQLRVIAPTWGQGLVDGLKTVWNPTNVSATLSHAFTSGGGFLDAAKALGAQAGGVLMDKVGTALSAMGPWGQAAAAALPAAMMLGKKIWGGIVGMFGGPSEEVQAARGDLEAFAGDVEARVGQTASSTERLQDFLASGWERNRALVVTFFQDQALASGRSAQAGVDHFTAYQSAMEAGNAELMAELEQQALDWNVVNAAAAEEQAAAWAETYTAETVASTTMTDEAIANSLRLKDAVVAHTVEMLATWVAMASGMQEKMQAVAANINKSLDSIKDRTVTITTVHRTAGIAGATPNVSGYVSPGAGRGGGGTQPIVIKNTVHLSRREVTTAVAEDVFREVRRRVGG